jgi:GNAT superfamily N-acetyltransferase
MNKLKCADCGGNLELQIGFDGCDWDSVKGDGSGFEHEIRLVCDCGRYYPIGRVKKYSDFCENIESRRAYGQAYPPPEPFTIAVDFDGTLCVDKFPDIGEPRLIVIEHIKRRAARGQRIILNTCRENGTARRLLDEAVEFCEAHGIPLYAVNNNPDSTRFQELYGTPPARKVYADLYIDDKAMSATYIERIISWGREEELF